MVVFSAIGAAIGVAASTVFSVAMTVTSVIYQRIRQQQMQEKMEEEMNKQKGFEIAVDGDTFDLGVVYGKAKIAGGRTYYRVHRNFVYADPPPIEETVTRTPETGFLYDTDNYIKVQTTSIPAYRHYSGNETTTYEIKFNGEYFTPRNVLTSPTIINPFSGTLFSPINSAPRLVNGKIRLGWNLAFPLGNQQSTETNQFIAGTTGPDGQEDTIYGTTTIEFYSVAKEDVIGNDFKYFDNGLFGDQEGKERQFLFVQQAISYASISDVIDVDVNDKSWDINDYKYGQAIHIYLKGSVADPMATANLVRGISPPPFDPSTNYFTNTAYASMCFKLNRDDYNYSGGIPNVTFYIKGCPIRSVTTDGSTYNLSETKSYSNNPAYCMLDYLTNADYGLGLSELQIDLESFYKAAQVCDEVVMTGQKIGGKINGVRPSKEGDAEESALIDVKRFECNIVLDSGDDIRTNIERLLETMSGAELVWSSGKYKLNLPYPTSQVEEDALIVDTFTDADIVRNEIKVTWPSAQERYNQATVRFRNESEDFGEDSVTWPYSYEEDPDGDTQYGEVFTQYLEEDVGQLSNFETFAAGITDKYHALAMAEQLVRQSRRSAVLEMTVVPRGMLLEPGDLIRVKDTVTGLQDDENFPNGETYKIESVKVNDDLTVQIQAVAFSYADLAWNVPDDIGYSRVFEYTFETEPVSNVTFTPTDPFLLGVSSGRLTWVEPEDVYSYEYVIEAKPIGSQDWETIGYTRATSFELQGFNTGAFNFAVRSKTAFGGLSTRELALFEGSDIIDLNRLTIDQVLIVYADSDDELTNNQSTTLGDNEFVAYYRYNGDVPTLPIRVNISFSRFVGNYYNIVPEVVDGSTVFKNKQGYVTFKANVFENGVEITDYTGWVFSWQLAGQSVAGPAIETAENVTVIDEGSYRTVRIELSAFKAFNASSISVSGSSPDPVYLLDSNGDYVIDSGSNQIFVRE